MSELKVLRYTDFVGSDSHAIRRLCYEKSEADKVIDNQKFKRCLAMAMWCEAEAQNCLTRQSALIDFPEIDRFQYLQLHFVHFSRWHKRWLKLAEKFKEAK